MRELVKTAMRMPIQPDATDATDDDEGAALAGASVWAMDDEAVAMFAAADAYAASADLALAQQSLDAWFAKSVTRATETTAATP